ncbi:MAG: hypothetical protein R2764_20570 [Bacteroidales bacterium]
MQAGINLSSLKEVIKSGDEDLFIHVVEKEALGLHALMMSSNEGFTLLNKNTWNIIEWVRRFRKENNVFLSFTLDAGPNVHVLYKESDRNRMEQAIRTELIEYCEDNKWIDDQLGSGPILLT